MIGLALATSVSRVMVRDPVITQLLPSSGVLTGVAMIIKGTGLTGTTSVSVGGTPALLVLVLNDSTVTCVTPILSLGAKSLTLTNAAGTSAPLTFTVTL